MIQVLSKEFNSFLNSLIAYVVIGVFLMSIGLLMWVFPETSVLEYGYADMETLFRLGPYVFMFLDHFSENANIGISVYSRPNKRSRHVPVG